MLRARIVEVDAQVYGLLTQRQSLVEQYERHRFAILGRTGATPLTGPPAVAAAPPKQRQEWSGKRVRALMLGLGAALLGISALTFTAVAWSRLGDGGRAALLVGATALVIGLALALRRRLPMTAEAFAGLAIALVLVDLYAVRRAGLGADISWRWWWGAGTVATAGFAALLGRLAGRRTTRFAVAALLPIAPELLADAVGDTQWAAALVLAVLAAVIVYARARWKNLLYPEGKLVLAAHGVLAWLGAAVSAAFAAGQPTTVAGALLPALAVASLAAAAELLRRSGGSRWRTIAAAVAAGVPAGVVLTLAGPLVDGDGLLTVAVIVGAITILAASIRGGGYRSGGLVAGSAFVLPGALWALTVAAPAVLAPLGHLVEPWRGSVHSSVRDAPTSIAAGGSWAAVGSLVALAALCAVLGRRWRPLFGIACAAIGLTIALTAVTAGATVLVALVVTVSAAVLFLLASAWAARAGVDRGWELLAGAAVVAVPTAGWAAVSPPASVVTSAVIALAAGAAAVIAQPPATRVVTGVLAAALAVVFVGVATRAAGADAPAAGFAAAVAAAAVVLFGVFPLRDRGPVGIGLEAAGAVLAVAGVLAASGSRAWQAGALTVLALVAVLAGLRGDRRTRYGGAAGVLSLCATWAWLDAAGVNLVEAYTAPAALVALAAGIAQWRTGPGRSWLTLGPALVLAIGPTLLIGIADGSPVRLIVAALLSLAAVIAGGVLRLQAPLCLGAVALLTLAIDQWGAQIVGMPRWITLGAAGVLLMWIGATFEHRRRDWRRTTEVVGRFG